MKNASIFIATNAENQVKVLASNVITGVAILAIMSDVLLEEG